MKKIYYTTIIPLTLALATLASCNGKLQQAFHESPSDRVQASISSLQEELISCLLYTSDAADDSPPV